MFTFLNGYLRSHFAPAFYLLPAGRRRDLRALYGVFRLLDDAVDAPRRDPAPVLAAWRTVFSERTVAAVQPFGHRDAAEAALRLMDDYAIPDRVFLDFIDQGVAVDLEGKTFGTPMDTESYCYGVAGTVGVACLPIFGVPCDGAKDFAIRLGIAVQWVNMIRDVGVDAAMGRVYLPLDHLERFECAEADIRAGRAPVRFGELMAYEARVARGHYARAMELMPLRWKKELLPARVMGGIYMKLLEKLERRRYPVFSTTTRLSFIEKGLATWGALKDKTTWATHT